MSNLFPNASQVEVIRIDIGDRVVCDNCNEEWTNRPESGGLYGFGSKAIGPCCAAKIMESAKRYGEEKYIKAFCPPTKSFYDWVREDLR